MTDVFGQAGRFARVWWCWAGGPVGQVSGSGMYRFRSLGLPLVLRLTPPDRAQPKEFTGLDLSAVELAQGLSPGLVEASASTERHSVGGGSLDAPLGRTHASWRAVDEADSPLHAGSASYATRPTRAPRLRKNPADLSQRRAFSGFSSHVPR